MVATHPGGVEPVALTGLSQEKAEPKGFALVLLNVMLFDCSAPFTVTFPVAGLGAYPDTGPMLKAYVPFFSLKTIELVDDCVEPPRVADQLVSAGSPFSENVTS